MEVYNRQKNANRGADRGRFLRFGRSALYYLAVTLCLISIFHSSLLVTSQPLRADENAAVERAINLLDAKGFGREAFLLRHFTVFRNTDSWLNSLTQRENAYAAANFPFNIITLYPDFFTKAQDDTERAIILLHEVQHLRGADEHEAYEFAWRNREKVGWTILTHGTTESYINIEAMTRQTVPELFNCPDRMWNDCTGILKPATVARKK
jgi:hypothetical protein